METCQPKITGGVPWKENVFTGIFLSVPLLPGHHEVGTSFLPFADVMMILSCLRSKAMALADYG
jgi:hypothetical protein